MTFATLYSDLVGIGIKCRSFLSSSLPPLAGEHMLRARHYSRVMEAFSSVEFSSRNLIPANEVF